jgi:hypothetical protein
MIYLPKLSAYPNPNNLSKIPIASTIFCPEE